MESCDEVMLVVAQENGDASKLPMPRFFTEDNCQGSMYPPLNAANFPPSFSCSNNQSCSLYTEFSAVGSSDNFFKSFYLPPGYKIEMSGNTADPGSTKCASTVSGCDNNACAKNIKEECKNTYETYNESQTVLQPRIIQKANFSSSNDGKCPILPFAFDATIFAAARQCCTSQLVCTSPFAPLRCCNAAGGVNAIVPSGITFTDVSWQGSINNYRVALCMGHITNDPGKPASWNPQSEACDSFMTGLCQTSSQSFNEECACLRDAASVSEKYNFSDGQFSIASRLFHFVLFFFFIV